MALVLALVQLVPGQLTSGTVSSASDLSPTSTSETDQLVQRCARVCMIDLEGIVSQARVTAVGLVETSPVTEALTEHPILVPTVGPIEAG